ncbi:MAG: DUF4124 domain-containing protein [Steroidobacteraceae bacterium]
MEPLAAPGRPYLAAAFRAALVVCIVACGAGPAAAASPAVYKWVDANGVTHLSSDKPPAGVPYERVTVWSGGPSSRSSSSSTGSANSGSHKTASDKPTRLAAVSPEQVARRDAVVGELQTRECVVALEAMDRLARGGKPVDPVDFKRLQQTADANCSSDPATRRQQEEMAAKLRVAKGDTCIDARNQLAEMLEPGRRPTRAQVKAQQEFIEAHCESPVR